MCSACRERRRRPSLAASSAARNARAGATRTGRPTSRGSSLSWPGLNDLLPDGGLPRGVVELAAPRALGGSTSVALAAVRAGQERSAGRVVRMARSRKGRSTRRGWSAAGVDLGSNARRPASARAARAGRGEGRRGRRVRGRRHRFRRRARCFADARATVRGAKKKRTWAPEVLVRKLALCAESSGTTVLLLTDSARPRAIPWPVALRLELSRPNRNDLVVRVAKDRRGRIGLVRPYRSSRVPVARPATWRRSAEVP